MIRLTMTTSDGDTIEVANRVPDASQVVVKITDKEQEHFVMILNDDEVAMLANFFLHMAHQ